MEIHNRLEYIDSRDIVDRYNEIVGDPDFLDEATRLEKLIKQGESCSSDWNHGLGLTHEDSFVEYTKESIENNYDDINTNSNEWPYRHMKIDFEAAAEELKQDYTAIDFDGETYYIRA